MTDLVQRLRQLSLHIMNSYAVDLAADAADAIDALRAENARLREQIEQAKHAYLTTSPEYAAMRMHQILNVEQGESGGGADQAAGDVLL